MIKYWRSNLAGRHYYFQSLLRYKGSYRFRRATAECSCDLDDEIAKRTLWVHQSTDLGSGKIRTVDEPRMRSILSFKRRTLLSTDEAMLDYMLKKLYS